MIPIFPEREFAGRYRSGEKFATFKEYREMSAIIFRNSDRQYWDEWTHPGLHFIQFIDDVDGPTDSFIHPTPENIAKNLAFSREPGREKITCCCEAGISRSSAMAVLIAYDRTRDIEKSLSVLSRRLHYPNPSIIEIGEQLLNAEGLSEAVKEWKRRDK